MPRTMSDEAIKAFEKLDKEIKGSGATLTELRELRNQLAVNWAGSVGEFSDAVKKGKFDKSTIDITYKGKGTWKMDELDKYLIDHSIYYSYQYPDQNTLIKLLAEHKRGGHDEAWFINQVKAECEKITQREGTSFKKETLATKMDAVIKAMKKAYGDNFKGKIDNPIVINRRASISDTLDDIPASLWE